MTRLAWILGGSGAGLFAASLIGCPGAAGDAELEAAATAVEAPARPYTREEVLALEPVGEPIVAEITSAPNVPPPVDRDVPKRVIVNMPVVEVTRPIADGTEYTFWTFGGDVPGKFIRVRQGDTVEFHLQNDPTSKVAHNIDLHAVSGQGGGAEASATAPGHETVFEFKAMNAGLFVYHCATAPVPMHIANGMYGMILVEPPGGLPPVDRELYVMQGDFYTTGAYHEKGLQSLDMQKAIDENPTYVLFNGAEGALVGDKAMKSKVGDKVRIYFGVGGPNLTSSFHVIGEIFDRVYTEGGTRYQENVQTTMVPAGGSAIVDFTIDSPATYLLVDHSITRVFNKGAVAMLKADGPADERVITHVLEDRPYAGVGGAKALDPAVVAAAEARKGGTMTKEEQIASGKVVYDANCAACHQADGKGMANVFPPLAGSDLIVGDTAYVASIPVNGLSGKIVVNGKEWNATMPPLGHLSDAEIADALTYARNAWGNNADAITEQDVAAVRGSVTDAKE